jgi:hypothetical protein
MLYVLYICDCLSGMSKIDKSQNQSFCAAGYANRVKRWFARLPAGQEGNQEEISSRSGKYTEVDRLETAAHEYERELHCINTVRSLYQPILPAR